jgi:DNA-binding LacI/PurR family transcriptional regulator
LPNYELGDTAVRLLFERVEGKRTRAKTVTTLQPQLRVRESCGFMLRSIKAGVTA